MGSPVRFLQINEALVRVCLSKADMGRAAAANAASILGGAISRRGCARVIVATGNSQEDVIGALVKTPALEWNLVEVFHMDEYVGMPASHPASFRRWLRIHLVDLVQPGRVHYLNGDAADLVEECIRYGNLLSSAPVDLCFLGFGENGHIAFNDPHVADFNDPLVVKRVDLDETCRLQQVGEGHFQNLEAVPREALTITCPVLVGAEHLICCVPDRRKAEAVRNALEGPISHACPGSVLRTHPRAFIYLDGDSASLLTSQPLEIQRS